MACLDEVHGRAQHVPGRPGAQKSSGSHPGARPRVHSMEPPLLTVDELTLTAPTEDDAADWAAAQDDECAQWFDWPCRPSLERCREHLRHVTADQDPDSYTWAIRTLTGFGGGIDLKLDDGAWNVSYFVHPEHRGRHVARRALRAVTHWGLSNLGIDVVSTRVHTENIASQKVLEAAGFSRTGVVDSIDGDHRDFTYEHRG